MSDITKLTATEIAQKIKIGDLSARDAVEAHIRRIEEVNPSLNAVVIPLFEQARKEAETADEVQRRGHPLGLLQWGADHD